MINSILLAAGSGQRMTNKQKKQYLVLNGLPLLCHSLKIFDEYDKIDNIYLVLPKADISMCLNKIIFPMNLKHKVKLVAGGQTRQLSVLNALNTVKDDNSIVTIHDTARPFVTKKIISRCIEGFKKTGACIPAIPSTDSIKKIVEFTSFVTNIERKKILLAQTPQVFHFKKIYQAYSWAKKNHFYGTDDSSIVERIGIPIHKVKGDIYNIKITTQKDLLLAEVIAKIKQNTTS